LGLFRNAASVLSVSVLGVAVGLVTSVILARFLSVEDRGSYSVAMTFIGMATLLSQLGWSAASIYRLRRVGSEPARVVGAALLATMALAGLAVAVCLGLRSWIWTRFLPAAPPLVLLLIVATLPFQLAGVVFSGIARGLDRFSLSNLHQIAVTLGSLIALTLTLVVCEGALVQAVQAYLCVQAVCAVGLVVAVVRVTGVELRVRWGELRSSLVFGLRSYLQSLAGQLHERVDVFMIAYMLADPVQVAFYAVAANAVQRLKLVPESISKALFPQLAGTSPERSGPLAARVLRHSSLWVGISVVGLVGAGPFLLPWMYGPEYVNSVRPFLVLLPGMALLTVYRVLARYFIALGRQRVPIATQLVSLSLNVGLNLVLIPRLGIAGAAVASLGSYALEGVLIYFAFRRHSGQGLRQSFVFRWEDLEVYRRRVAPLARRLRSTP